MSSLKSEKRFKIGSRSTPLALAQVQEVLLLLKAKGMRFEHVLVKFQSQGDKDKITSLIDQAPDDFFTDTIDQALLKGEIDFAVHSAKDVPKDLHQGLAVLALTRAFDETDALVGRAAHSQMQPGAKVGTSSPLRQKAVEKIFPGATLVPVRGSVNERIQLVQDGKLDGVIIATCALKRLGLARLITEILPYETTPLQGQLAVVGRKNEIGLNKIFSGIDVRRTYGNVTLVGAGPGDPELVTIKALRFLKEADVVFYDYLVDPKLLQYSPKAKKIFVGKRKGVHTISQDDLNRMLRDQARNGKRVVRLKGGDPLIFGRGPNEIEYLSSYHINVDVVPGVSSATGIPSALGIPLTARGISSSVAFLSAHGEDEKEGAHKPIAIPEVDTLVFLMGLTKLQAIVRSLKEHGWPDQTPMMIISKGTCSDERILNGTIGSIETLVAKEPVEPPALMIVGKTLDFWKHSLRRDGNILYLGTNPKKYQGLGRVVHCPMIKIVPAKFSTGETKRLQDGLKEHQLIIFTSRFAVKYFMALMKKERYASKTLNEIEFAVVGKDTANELAKYKLSPKVVAAVETAEGLFAALQKAYDLKGMKILFPRSNLPNPFLKNELVKSGAKVSEIKVYENQKPQTKQLSFQRIDKVIFTSPSTVKNFLNDFGMIPQQWMIFAKGPVTQKTLVEAGYKSEILID